MDDSPSSLRNLRDDRLAHFETHLFTKYAATRIPSDAIIKGYLMGWNLESGDFIPPRSLKIFIQTSFPFTQPDIFVVDSSKYYLHIPHIAYTGKVCLLTSAATFSPDRYEEVIDYLLEKTKLLLESSESSKNNDEFLKEYHNYLSGLEPLVQRHFWSIIRYPRTSKIIHYWSGKAFILFGDTQKDCEQWLTACYGNSGVDDYSTDQTVFAWLDTPLLPIDYPKHGVEVRHLLEQHAPEVIPFLKEINLTANAKLPVIIGFDSPTGIIYTGFIVNGDRSQNGFRKGKMPKKLQLERYFNSNTITHITLDRIDPSSILARNGKSFDKSLLNKRVCLVGVGSLGGEIAIQLAKSGVGELILIDNDVFHWENVGRHVLGGESVGKLKVEAMKKYVQSQMPWVNVSIRSSTVELLLFDEKNLFDDVDLIISTTGNWSGNCSLNVAQRSFPRFPNVIYGWTEAYGVAGHALSVRSNGGCLCCGSTEYGAFNDRVYEWNDEESNLMQAIGCSDLYQPYSVVDVAQTYSMISEIALEILLNKSNHSILRTWIGDITRAENLGGRVSSKWASIGVGVKLSKRFYETDWLVNPICSLCH